MSFVNRIQKVKKSQRKLRYENRQFKKEFEELIGRNPEQIKRKSAKNLAMSDNKVQNEVVLQCNENSNLGSENSNFYSIIRRENLKKFERHRNQIEQKSVKILAMSENKQQHNEKSDLGSENTNFDSFIKQKQGIKRKLEDIDNNMVSYVKDLEKQNEILRQSEINLKNKNNELIKHFDDYKES